MDYEKIAREIFAEMPHAVDGDERWVIALEGSDDYDEVVEYLAARLREIVPENGVDVGGLVDDILKDIDDAWELEDEVEHKTLCRTISRHLSDASERIKELEAERDALSESLAATTEDYNAVEANEKRLREAKDTAYAERNKMVCFLSTLYPSHMKRHPESDTEWEDDWRNIVCIHGPAGQMTWHIHDSECHLFGHLNRKPEPFTDCEWDGHTTDQKYQRLMSCGARAALAPNSVDEKQG